MFVVPCLVKGASQAKVTCSATFAPPTLIDALAAWIHLLPLVWTISDWTVGDMLAAQFVRMPYQRNWQDEPILSVERVGNTAVCTPRDNDGWSRRTEPTSDLRSGGHRFGSWLGVFAAEPQHDRSCDVHGAVRPRNNADQHGERKSVNPLPAECVQDDHDQEHRERR